MTNGKHIQLSAIALFKGGPKIKSYNRTSQNYECELLVRRKPWIKSIRAKVPNIQSRRKRNYLKVTNFLIFFPSSGISELPIIICFICHFPLLRQCGQNKAAILHFAEKCTLSKCVGARQNTDSSPWSTLKWNSAKKCYFRWALLEETNWNGAKLPKPKIRQTKVNKVHAI